MQLQLPVDGVESDPPSNLYINTSHRAALPFPRADGEAKPNQER